MRVTQEKFAENNERIRQVAGALFREHGFSGVGVADIMNAAGMTHGGFYGHFESKEELAEAASRDTFARSGARWKKIVADSPKRPLNALLEHYVSARHRDNCDTGCSLVMLGGEAARGPVGLRQAFTDGMTSLVEVLAGVVRGRTRAAKRRKALSTLSEMVGAMVLARAVNDPKLSAEILDASTREILEAAE